MKIIVGLGNPGLRYRNTRHNTGFLVLAALSRKYRLPLRKKGFGGLYAAGAIRGCQVMLFEPMTYMNLSGGAVKAVCSSRLERSGDLIVVSDDVSLPFGGIRLRRQGSSGGHNGLQSIIEHMGQDFTRLRIGIGPAAPEEDLAAYVLARFSRGEKAALGEVIEKAVQALEIWLEADIEKAISRCNSL